MTVVIENLPSTNWDISDLEYFPDRLHSMLKKTLPEKTLLITKVAAVEKIKICKKSKDLQKIKAARQDARFNLLQKIFLNSKKMSDIIS